ncbi:MAG: Na+/H+ antiporter subunit E [Gammaproteobacteria bacterium]|nr:MAG: Na+/H+ antiporter subunit E [Gammaproteobacteria bacterium]
MHSKPRVRLLPMPLHSLLLFVVWLLLNNTLAPGHLVLAAFLAIVIPLMIFGMQDPQPGFRKPIVTIRFITRVIGDIIVANIEVALLVVGSSRSLNPAFVAVPLELRYEFPITVLTSTVSLTPGTVSAEVSQDKQWLYVHVLNLKDEDELIASIKQRYERPLMEIFNAE